MNFLFPLGLLGLIGIPILILIYIIKSKYTEQTVASTYLWTLSERFLKRKKPVSPITGIISLILQILTVAAISLLIAHPIITIPNSAQEYCFILDASGSMNMEENGKTRFVRAKEEIADLIDASTDGSRYTLLSVSDVTTTVFEATTDKTQALALLDELDGGYADPDLSDAIGAAQELFNVNQTSKTYLVTDTAYDAVENMEVINVVAGEKNVGLTGVDWKLAGGTLTLSGTVHSYSEDRTLRIAAYADGREDAVAETEVTVAAGQSAPFAMTATLRAFSSLRVAVDAADSLSDDDEYLVYNIKSENTYSILLVSDTPYFLKTVIGSIWQNNDENNVTVISPDEYTAEYQNYGLYIFDCCTPTQLPDDGAVWFFNPKGSVPDAGFSVQGEVALSRGETLEMTTSTSTVAQTMVQNIKGDEIYISKEYVKCSMYRSFTTLFSYKGNPMVFAGSNALGHREVVFAFDLHNSNLPLLIDYVVLIENLMTFSFPDVVEQVNYEVGDEAAVNVVSNCDSIRVQSPGGSVSYLSTDVATATFPMTEVGTYTITVTVSDVPSEFYMFASLPEAEREPAPKAERIGLQGAQQEGGFDGTFDPMFILFVLLMVLFLADWMVYCYEKYQLR